MNPLAPTTFSAGPKDSLASIDVYDASGQSVVNSIQDTSTKSTFDIGSILSNGGKGLLTGAGSLLKVSTTGSISLDNSTILKRLNTSVPQAAGALRGLSTDAAKSVTSSFKDYGTATVNMGGSPFNVDSAHVADLSGYSDYVNMVNAYGTGLGTPGEAIPGECSIYDVDSHASLISAGVIQGSDYALPTSFTTLTAPPAVIGNLSLVNKVTSACLPVLVKNGDLGNLRAMSATPGGQIFDAVLPNYGTLLTQGYSATAYGRNGNGGASVQDYESIISIFTNTNSSWNVFDRLGDTVNDPTLNLLKLIGGSRDFQELLAIGVKSLVDGDSGKHQILATMFQQTTVEAEVNRYFPRVILSNQLANSQTRKAQTIDPRVVNLIANTTRALVGNIPV
jgi:hypothetical protein